MRTPRRFCARGAMKKGGTFFNESLRMIRRWLCSLLLLCLTGCGILPRPVRLPTVHNPFPQLMRVAVAPFFNLSAEPTVDGRQFALSYYNELQLVPGFEVVPLGVVEAAVQQHRLALANPQDARKLAQLLEVDAVVIGAVTDYSPYYPPRCGLRVEWYTANPCFHPIPPGYALPWGTPGEKDIPDSLVLETEMALARAQLDTQTPIVPPALELPSDQAPLLQPVPDGQEISYDASAPQAGAPPGAIATAAPADSVLPADWPDPSGLLPAPPSTVRPIGQPTQEPVLKHTRTYNGHDAEFTEALSNYVAFRDDARYGGWQSYLQRSDDFIRFCCHKHICDMLSARGGAGETRVVWRWPDRR